MDGHINYLRDTLKAFPEVQLLRQGEFYRIEYTQAAFTCLSPSHALLLATPAHRTTREEISHELWPEEYGRTSKEVLNNRMDGHINYLRDTLKAFPEVQLLRQGEFYRIEYTQAAFTCLSPSHF